VSEPCEALPWDSEFFARRIGRVRADRLTDQSAAAAIEWAEARRIECLYFCADPSDVETLRVAPRYGFDLVDVRITLDARVDMPSEASPAAPRVRPVVDADLDALERIARESHRDSRFFRDHRFDPTRSADLFALWIGKSARGWADVTLVAETDGVCAGYITGHLQGSGAATIGLAGVAPAGRRRGCGRALVAALAAWLASRGVATMRVTTQGSNAPALAFYQRAGFAVSGIALWYHRWAA
jgi:dTDP-4-amino-4,6-dideoxy-D-galactose acyltransferase